MKYTPVIKDADDWHYYSLESRWGYTLLLSKFEKIPQRRVFLLPKETANKIKKFTKPIDMKRYGEIQSHISGQMDDFGKKAFNHVLRGEEVKIDVPEDYEEVKNKVIEDWKERLSHSGGTILLQFNAKVGLLGDDWVRFVQVGCSESTGEAPKEKYNEISWSRYFLFEVPRYFAVKTYCWLNNFKNKKSIKAEREKSKEASKEYDKIFQDYINKESGWK